MGVRIQRFAFMGIFSLGLIFLLYQNSFQKENKGGIISKKYYSFWKNSEWPTPRVEMSPSPSDEEIMNAVPKFYNLAPPHSDKAAPSEACVSPPKFTDIQFSNLKWQVLVTSNGTFYLYGAYFDGRNDPALIRLVSVVDRTSPPPTMCHLWFSDQKEPVTVPAEYTYSWHPKWGNYKDFALQPFVISCPLPAKDRVPASVSLVSQKCDKATNDLGVVNNNPIDKKEDIAVCVKALDYLHADISLRLIEWLELVKLLGAHKVFMYEYDIHPNVARVIDHYRKSGFVDSTPLTLPGGLPNIPGYRHLFLNKMKNEKRQHEIIPYNDCLYRNINMYKYLALLDLDEVIVPLKHESWSSMLEDTLKETENKPKSCYDVRNVYFFDQMESDEEVQHEALGIPPYFHMLQHVYRSMNFTKPGHFVKSFHNTDLVISMHNHYPRQCFGGCSSHEINTTVAQLQHYRKNCEGTVGEKSCKEDFQKFVTRDTTIWRYKTQIIERSNEVLKELGFLD